MGTGYTRNDTADNIADGNIINASDLDGEFDALQSAFDNSTGHTHDGTAGEGAPIEKVGPNQEVVVTATVLRPAANNTIDLGVETTNEFKNLYIDGTAYLDSVDIDGGTIDGLSVLTVDNLSLNGNTITTTNTNGNLNLRANGTGIISVGDTDLNFGDGDKATFGDGSDLSITHNGTNSIITDSGTGNLLLRGSNVSIQNAAGNETVAQFVQDSFVKLYHDNSQVFSTTSTGISVTGDVNASDDLILSSDSSKITFGADGDVELEHIHNFGLTLKTTGTGDNAFPEFVLQSNEDTIIDGEVIGRIDFDTNSTAGGVSVGAQARITVDATDTYSSTVAGSRMEFYTTESGGALNKAMVIDPDQSIRFTGGTDVKLDATNDTLDFPDNFKIMMGAGDDLQIYHDGSHSYVTDQGTGRLYLQGTSNVTLTNADGTAEYANFANGGAASFRYNNSVKLATASTGVDITGAFTATDGSTITVNDNSVALNLVSTDTDATQGPVFRLTRSAVGAASDVIGTIQYLGQDVAGNSAQYVELESRIGDATDGAEDGELVINTLISGSSRSRLNLNSTEAVFNEGSQDIDFRVESNGNANMLFVDGGNNRIGMGTNAPDYPLVVQAANSRLQLLNTGTNTGTSGILFGDADTATRGQINYNHASDSLDVVVNAAERMRITSSGSVGIGTAAPNGVVELRAGDGSGTLNIVSTVNATDSGNKIAFFAADRSDTDEEMAYIQPLLVSNSGGAGNVQEGHLTFGTFGTERMRIASNGFVGIGDSDPGVIVEVVYSDSTLYDDDANAATDCALRIHNNSNTTGAYSGIKLHSNNNNGTVGQWMIGSVSTGTNYDNNLVFHTRTSSSAYAERMRIDTSGNFMIGKTAADVSAEGFEARSSGNIHARTADGPVLDLRRGASSSSELIATFRDDNTGMIKIGESGGAGFIEGRTGDTGLKFEGAHIRPRDNQTDADNAVDLGNASFRFDDIFATNATINTSDRNEKQQIAALTDTEITAAKAISKLFKNFKWNDRVTEKGDAARTHTGIIAQEVEQAMTDAGLSANNYAFFISSTWWETQTDVPAVAAVAEVTETTTDEDGNEVVTVVTEAVEARDAYTRTDTYETAEEAPEGATERNRKGIRYTELLAFIGAATEQRLTSIELRLAALEAE